MTQDVSAGEMALRLVSSMAVIAALLGLLVVVARRYGSKLNGLGGALPNNRSLGGRAKRRSAGRGFGAGLLARRNLGGIAGIGGGRFGGGRLGGDRFAESRLGGGLASLPRLVGGGDARSDSTERRLGLPRRPRNAPRPSRPLEVLDRQALSRTATVSVVRVGSKALLVGATESSLSVLADVSSEVEPPPEVQAEAETAALEQVLRQWTGATASPNGSQPAGMELVEAVFERFGLPG